MAKSGATRSLAPLRKALREMLRPHATSDNHYPLWQPQIVTTARELVL